MKKNGFLLIALLVIGLAANVSAQKYGHMNYGNLLAELPQVTSADEQLKSFQEPLLQQVQSKYAAFETKYKAAVASAQNGELSPVQQKQKETELQQEQQSITAFEQDVQQQILKKREELLTPILEKIDLAIKDVAQSNGYTIIFDTSKGQMLYVTQSDDVTDMVKAKIN